jgi:hypothetical protein
MKSTTRAVFVASFYCVALSAVTGVAQAERASDSLRPIVKCLESGGVRVRAVGRLPEQVTSRSVTTQRGEARVSLADGYRLIVDAENGIPFVNLKIERSATDSFQSDRAAVRAQMERFSEQRPRRSAPCCLKSGWSRDPGAAPA